MENSNSNPSKNRALGCGLGCMVVFFAVFLGGYLTIFHSSLPVRFITSKIVEVAQAAGVALEIDGVSGSLSKGISIENMVIPGTTGTSTISALTFHHNGITKWGKGEVVIKELSTESADFVVSEEFFNMADNTNLTATSSADMPSNVTVNTTTTDMPFYGVFELRKLKLANTRFRTADGQIDLNIPLIHLSGLKITDKSFELDELEVESDLLELKLVKASPQQVDGQMLDFKKRIEGVVREGAHKSVTAPIVFSVDMTADGWEMTSRTVAFDGAMEQILMPDGQSIVHFRNLTLSDYVETPGRLLPEQMRFTAPGE